ncbi:hypothetical protein [Rhodothermus profundi]|uniref:Uncharacterized protein n=1 Tax=Rhodothermus profundi TaxID=633813 RepID=A0A1M6X4A7_9BACT|nr:hypothetical protein [Rhodothermus profundi]SHL00754.1 hypothetical protein SAMN04488087_2495 [Rhodothermus profundi]
MQSLLTYISGLLSVFVLFLQLWQFAPLDRALLTAVLTGLGAFFVLHLGYVAIRWILTLAPPRQKSDASEPPQETTAHKSDTDQREHSPQMTAPAAA